MTRITNLHRDYLAEIYRACCVEREGQQGLVTSAELAERLFASPSTVNRIIQRLGDAGLINHSPYRGVELTAVGEREARRIMRRQAIIESFLYAVLGLEWHELHDEAQRLRHVVTETLLQRMWAVAGHPERSPFGEQIGNGWPFSGDEVVLALAPIKQDYTITRVLTRLADRLEYLAALGLKPDVPLHLIHRAPFNGPLQIRVGHEFRIIGHELASWLTVVPTSSRVEVDS